MSNHASNHAPSHREGSHEPITPITPTGETAGQRQSREPITPITRRSNHAHTPHFSGGVGALRSATDHVGDTMTATDDRIVAALKQLSAQLDRILAHLERLESK